MFKQMLRCCVFVVILGFGSLCAATPEGLAEQAPKTIVKNVKQKPASQIKNKTIHNAARNVVLTDDEKAIRKAYRKEIKIQERAIRKANKNAARQMKATQKANARALRKAERQANQDQRRARRSAIRQPARVHLAGEETASMQNGMPLPERDHHFKKPEHLAVPVHQIPVEPTDLVILAVGIVVSPLCAADLVAGYHQRNTFGEEENG